MVGRAWAVGIEIDDGESVLLRERRGPIKKLEPISSEVALQHPDPTHPVNFRQHEVGWALINLGDGLINDHVLPCCVATMFSFLLTLVKLCIMCGPDR